MHSDEGSGARPVGVLAQCVKVEEKRKQKNKNIKRYQYVNSSRKNNIHFTTLTLLVANLEATTSIKEKNYQAIVINQQCKLQLAQRSAASFVERERKTIRQKRLTTHGKGMQDKLTKIRASDAIGQCD